MSFSEFTPQDYELIEKGYEELMAAARPRCANAREIRLVQKAFDFANEAHKNVRRRSGEPYILHPLAVARIVASAFFTDATRQKIMEIEKEIRRNGHRPLL